MIAKNYLKFQL